jgi:hypothetical protein
MVQPYDGVDDMDDIDGVDGMRAMPERSDRRADTADGRTEQSSRMQRAGSQNDGVNDGPNDGRATRSWQDIKSRFVDDPAGAIAAAEDLVRQAVDDKIRAIKNEAAAICAPVGDDHDDGMAATENRRMRLLQYQAYYQRLASSSAHYTGTP